MKIKTLELKNFRPYYGDIKLNFPVEGDTPICLIHGHNGYGKTSLFYALNWCLYGHEKLKDAFEYFNISAREEERPSMSVKIVFDDNGREITVLRRIISNKPINSIRDLANAELVVFDKGRKIQTQDDQVLQEFVNDILPLEASQFSFFDGEKIETYSSDNVAEETQGAIASVLGLTLLTKAQDDLGKLAIELDRDRRRLLERAQDGKVLADEMFILDQDIDEGRKQKSERELEYKKLLSVESSLQDQLVSQEAAKSILSDIKELEEKINSANERKVELVIEIKEASKSLYLDILEPVIADQVAIAQRSRDNLISMHIESVRDETIQNLMQKIEQSGICICGRVADTKHINFIRSALELSDGGDANHLNSTEIDQIKQLTTQLESALNLSRGKISYAELAAKLGLIENELDELETSLAAKKSQLGGVDEEAVSSLAGALEKTQKDKRKIDQEIGSIEKTISDNLAKKRKLEAKISGISGQVHGLDLLNCQLQLLEKSSEAFGEIVRRSALAKQGEIQDASTGFFRNITNKAFGYERMMINDDFSFGVETYQKTRPPMALISAGEKQVTALSFILGLNEFTRRQAPIFMDTPMGRLDETHRRNVAKVLFDLAKMGRQIILLVTDTDIAFGVYSILKPGVGAEFEIVHNQENLTSKIQKRIL
ncbi:MAG: AAA family ATPase [Anaerolineales bacterium]|nr:AAA family ATPase [Anaerolineales bacterium]